MGRHRTSIRTRLTLLYGGMFFVAGLLLVGAGYLLARHTLTTGLRDINSAMMLDANSLPEMKRDFWLGRLAEQRAMQEAALRQLLLSSLVATGAVGLLSVGAGWVMAGRVLGPLHRITETARGVAERNLGERIRLAGPADELKELADTFDEMLERLDRAFDGQRRFVANASHELRTPLAASRTLIQVALGRSDASPDARRLGAALLTINDQQRELTDALLVLGRSEYSRITPRPVDLAGIALRVTSELTAEASSAGIGIQVDPGPATAQGDPTLLELLVRNLVQNGIRHNTPGGWVHVALGPAEQGGAWLMVSNTGAKVLTEADIPVIFEPFQRLGAPRTGDGVGGGAGLGLSIVRSISLAHGGQLAAAPRPGGGLTVRVRLPGHVRSSANSASVVPARRTTPPPSASIVGKL
ncbi:sensor histidine kinase [Plantactinospora sp. CA-290183]|uniref:sensor histidine kinase n=1 Tax=Plantactinospora sp. CA-290183 TaxID=3240006 RepID=UPI003D9425F0